MRTEEKSLATDENEGAGQKTLISCYQKEKRTCIDSFHHWLFHSMLHTLTVLSREHWWYGEVCGNEDDDLNEWRLGAAKAFGQKWFAQGPSSTHSLPSKILGKNEAGLELRFCSKSRYFSGVVIPALSRRVTTLLENYLKLAIGIKNCCYQYRRPSGLAR